MTDFVYGLRHVHTFKSLTQGVTFRFISLEAFLNHIKENLDIKDSSPEGTQLEALIKGKLL